MSWEYLKISDFAEVITGGTPSTTKKEYWEGGTIPWLNSGELNQEIVVKCDNLITELGIANSAAKLMPQDTVLIALTGATTGVVGYLTFEACANQSVTGILPSKRHHPKFLYYYLKSIREKVLSESYGGAQKHISQGYVKDLEIPLPPLTTQKRIAEILDAADALRRKDQELLKKYDELAQAIFIDMFGDPVKNENGWDVKKLDAVCSKITDGEHGTVSRLANGKPYLMARNIRDGFIDFTETDFISEADHNRIFKRCNPEKGDLLLVCVGATIGRVCLMNSNDEFSLARSVALIKPKKNLINSKFLFSIFKSDFIQLQIKAANNSSAQAGLYTGKIKDLNIFMPPIELQNEFEIRINVLLEQSQCIDISKSLALFKSLIQKAFKGELIKS
jgi:type I restriction enzyme S subunit